MIRLLVLIKAFLTVVASSRFPSTNNQLRTSSNTRNQDTIQDGRVIVQRVQGRQGKNYSGTTYKGNATSSRRNTTSGQERVVKCYNYQGEGHMTRQCTPPKRQRNATWYKEKAMLAEAHEAGQILDEEQLVFFADPRIPAGQAQTIIPHNAAFQTEDLDTYDSDCDDLSNAQAVLMANISNYGSDVILEEKANKEQNQESITVELERYKERVKTFEQHLNIDLSSHEKMIDSQMDDMIKEKLALKEKKAQRMKPTLYDGIVIYEKHVAMPVIDNEETLLLEKESRSKMFKKEKDPETIKQNISHKPIDYEKLNRLTKDFEKHFNSQQELSVEQAF
uniref:CCHC-type domain-containing protein n=1 Tax=Tanacetum cinerariifolium TaxID=118510 RepID=A0A699KP71_TANCI|nr:hypothetical protein [Tanacetum cinerariifolium]